MDRIGKLKTNILNIGQILLICFLFIAILTQTAAIISVPAADTPTPVAGEKVNSPNNTPSNINKRANIIPQQYVTEYNDTDIDFAKINAGNASPENIDAIFILGESNGKLALLSPDKNTVYEIFDLYINTLPEYDKNLLSNGIQIKSVEELRSLLEDYNS